MLKVGPRLRAVKIQAKALTRRGKGLLEKKKD